MASGAKSGSKDTGSVADLKGSGKVDRHEKTHNVEFAKGGNTKMFGEQAAGEQKPEHTGKQPTSAPGAEFAKGGSGKMFGFTAAQPAQSGITSAR
jgi:hypothetical protein